MKVYTKTGDSGTTSLIGGKRVSKSDIRLEAYGSVDELSSHLGYLISIMPQTPDTQLLQNVQNNLFVVGSQLALDPESKIELTQISQNQITPIEERIDYIETQLPKHKYFIMPGGAPAAAYAHVCRTVARRTERAICRLNDELQIDTNIIKIVNRLSDYLFVLARYINIQEKNEEIFWKNSCK